MTVVRILGREYRLRNAGDSDHAMAVAAYVDEVLREVQSTRPDTHDAIILAAMNIASELLRLKQNVGAGSGELPERRIRAMIDLIDSV